MNFNTPTTLTNGRIMRLTKSVTLAALVAASTVVVTPAASFAATGPTVYASSKPNQYVEYLILSESGNRVRGYFEIDRRSDDASIGATRTRILISQELVGNGLTFDNYTAVRTGDGFTVTSMAQDGLISEQHLSRASVTTLNASLGMLAVSIRRNRALCDLKAATAELHGRGATEQTPTSNLAKAQIRVDGAVVAARDLQAKADELWRVANDLRAGANAQLESPGVGPVQNDQLKDAMENADQAERKARFAQRLATLASTDVATAESDLLAARKRVALLRERIEASAAILKSIGDVADR